MFTKTFAVLVTVAGFSRLVQAADCLQDGLSIQTSDYQAIANAILTNDFGTPLSSTLSLGPGQAQPFPVVGNAAVCVVNHEVFSAVDYNLSDLQFGVQNILDQCFQGSEGFGGVFNINGNGGSVLLSVNQANEACL